MAARFRSPALLALALTVLLWASAFPAIRVGLAGLGVAAVYLGLLPSALGFVVWGYALARFSVATSTAALYLVPPVTLVVAFVWLGEIPPPVELLGGLISIAGVVLINARGAQGASRAYMNMSRRRPPISSQPRSSPSR